MNEPLHLNSPAVRQMVVTLPPGELVDRTILEGMDFQTISSVPVPNNLSPHGVQDALNAIAIGDNTSVALGSVFAGLRDPESVRVLAANAYEEWMRWAVHLNPASTHLAGHELPPMPRGLDEVTVACLRESQIVMAAAFPNLPWFRNNEELIDLYVQFVTHQTSFGPNTCPAFLRNWTWDHLPVAEDLLPEKVLNHWEGSWQGLMSPEELKREIARIAASIRSRGEAKTFLLELLVAEDNPDRAALIATRLRHCRDASVLGGPGFMNAWLPNAMKLDSHVWRTYLMSDLKPVSGRIAGEELYKVTGDDLGLWMAGLDLLENWDGSMPQWLQAVEALT